MFQDCKGFNADILQVLTISFRYLKRKINFTYAQQCVTALKTCEMYNYFFSVDQ